MSSARVDGADEVGRTQAIRDPLATDVATKTLPPTSLQSEAPRAPSVLGSETPIPESSLTAGDRGVVRRSLTIEIGGSLTQLASSGVHASWSLEKNSNAVFQPAASDKGFSDIAGGCDIGNSVMHRVEVTSIRSTFPCTVGVDITGITGTHATREGKKYALVVQDNTNWQGSKTLLEPDEMTNSEYLKKYPGMTPDKIAKEGIVDVPGESYKFVDCNHPVVEMLSVNQALLQVNMDEAELIDGRWYKVAGEVVNDCTKLLDQQLLRHLPLVDLNNFAVSMERLGGASWDRMDNIANDFSANKNMDPVLERVMSKHNKLTITLDLEYTFM